MTKTQTFADVWDAVADTPEDAAAMRLRADMMIAITCEVKAWKVTQREAAGRLGVTQPRLNELLKGRISKFSLEALMALAARAGLEVTFKVRPAAIAAARARAGGEAAAHVPVRAPAPAKRQPREAKRA